MAETAISGPVSSRQTGADGNSHSLHESTVPDSLHVNTSTRLEIPHLALLIVTNWIISRQCVLSQIPVLISYLFLFQSSVSLLVCVSAALGAKGSCAWAWEVRNETAVFFLLDAGAVEQELRQGARISLQRKFPALASVCWHPAPQSLARAQVRESLAKPSCSSWLVSLQVQAGLPGIHPTTSCLH